MGIILNKGEKDTSCFEGACMSTSNYQWAGCSQTISCKYSFHPGFCANSSTNSWTACIKEKGIIRRTHSKTSGECEKSIHCGIRSNLLNLTSLHMESYYIVRQTVYCFYFFLCFFHYSYRGYSYIFYRQSGVMPLERLRKSKLELNKDEKQLLSVSVPWHMLSQIRSTFSLLIKLNREIRSFSCYPYATGERTILFVI